MTNTARTIPGEIFYHIAQKDQSVDELIRQIYVSPGNASIEHFKSLNSHLKDNRVKAGQMVVVIPADSLQCTSFESVLAMAARLVDRQLANLSEKERQTMAQHYQLLNNITGYGGAGYGITLTYFSHHVKNIEATLKLISDLYVKTYNSHGNLNSRQFFQQRQLLFARLDNVMKSFVGHARMGYNFDATKIKHSLGLSSKSILHQWKAQPGQVTSVPGFEKNLQQTARLTKVLRRAGYVGIALDVGKSVTTIHEACTVGTDKDCTKTSFKEGGRLTGSVGGGTFGGLAAAYGTCNLLFGLESAGTSLLWCGIVVGAAGGYFGGKYGGDITGAFGEKLYETTLGPL